MPPVEQLSWYSPYNLLLLAALAFLLLATVERISAKGFRLDRKPWQRVLLGVFSLACFGLWLFLFLPTKVKEVERSIPLGTVIAWWGDWSDPRNRPDGFELCDGGEVHSETSPIKGQRKPALLGRFIRGAEASNQHVIAMNVSGGVDFHKELRTGGSALTVEQMPKHDHGGITAKDGAHPHKTSGRGAHDDDGGTDTHFALGDGKDERPWIKLDVLSDGSDHAHVIRSQGEGAAHDHVIKDLDNRPAFVELLYLIRVK